MADDLRVFLNAWRNVGQGASLVLPQDQLMIDQWKPNTFAWHRTWDDVITDPQFGSDKDSRLQLGLVPQPFMGDLEAAKVVVLLLNPGLAPADFHAEFEHPAFRDALLQNLRGELRDTEFPFLFLDPAWSWTGGYAWCYRRLRRIIACFEKPLGSRRAAQSFVAKNIAFLELIPYHSKDKPANFRQLKSVALAISAAATLRRMGKKIVIARAHEHWGLEESAGHVCNCPKSRGVNFPLTKPKTGTPLVGDFIVQALRSVS